MPVGNDPNLGAQEPAVQLIGMLAGHHDDEHLRPAREALYAAETDRESDEHE